MSFISFLLTGLFCFIVGSRAVQVSQTDLEEVGFLHRPLADVDSEGLDLEEAEVSQMQAHYRQWTTKNAEVIGKVADRMSRKDARKPARKKAVHLHVHNSAGSFMCTVAKSKGESVTVWPHNCNLAQTTFDDGPFTQVKTFGNSCSMRKKEMLNQGVTLSMIERWVDVNDGDWCPDDFVYTAIMRDPLARARTTLRLNERGNQEQVLSWLKYPKPAMRNGWLHSHVAYSDLVVRTLNGPGAMILPLGALNETHLQRAKEMLQAFDAVLAVPTMGADFYQLVEVLGWSPKPNAFDNQYSAKKHDELGSELEELLERHNKWDTQLYNFALELAASKTDLAIQRMAK